jgi:spermidine synthase
MSKSPALSLRATQTILLSILLMYTNVASARVIHKERSLYRNIIVVQTNNTLCLAFTVKRKDHNQSCIDLENPDRLVFPYVRMVFAALLVNPAPQKILVIGLGGGSIPSSLNKLYPEATIDISEIDEAIFRVATDYFDFSPNKQMKVSISDARVFVKRALLRKQRYDLVILDAFTGDYIPEHLMTREFLSEINLLLSSTGVLAANTFSTSRLYHHESVTYQQVFGEFFNFKMAGTSNRVIVASKAKSGKSNLPQRPTLMERANLLDDSLRKLGIKIRDYPLYMLRNIDWDTSVRPLTDQYSPANLLRD